MNKSAVATQTQSCCELSLPTFAPGLTLSYPRFAPRHRLPLRTPSNPPTPHLR
jgi:hypothetical protein